MNKLPDWMFEEELAQSETASQTHQDTNPPTAPPRRGGRWFHQLTTFSRRVWASLRSFVNDYLLRKNGGLSWPFIAFLAYRNLRNASSRTFITAAAIASGSAAIVFLVGFAYGLQGIVTNKLVQPLSLRLADVQAASTALRLDPDSVELISKLDGVEAASGAISIAGSLTYGGSRTETIVVGATNQFLEFSHISLLNGANFSDEAEMAYLGSKPAITALLETLQDGSGEVAGVSTSAATVTFQQPLDSQTITHYRIADDRYLPLHENAKITSPIIGYVKGSVLESYEGLQVWGGAYDSVNTQGKQYLDTDGTWYGIWMQTKSLPIYQRLSSTEFLPQTNEDGSQQKINGYLPVGELQVLSAKEAQADVMLDTLLKEQTGSVLGESTPSAEVTALAADSVTVRLASASSVATQAAALEALVAEESRAKQASEAAMKNAVISVAKPGGKEIIVSTGLLKIWQKTAEEVLGTQATVELIVSGGVIPGISGRVVSTPIEYTIVGVVDEPDKNVMYVPLSDLQSMGLTKFTLLKVLTKTNEGLQAVRERIESLGFSTRSIADTLAQVDRLFTVMRFLLRSFGMIAFIVALFGMFNTLTVSLLERTREIGVMKTLGTTNADVMRLFVTESALMGAVGGLSGIALGILTGVTLDLISYFFRDDKSASLFQFPIPFLLGIFIFSIFVGLVTGLYPASRAKKISALNALRYE